MLLRPARQDDLSSLVGLLRQLFAIEVDFTFDGDRHERGLRLLMERESAMVVVAEEQGVVVGMATGQLVISTAEGTMSVLVEDVVVDESYRNRGIGRGLIDSIAAWGSGREASRMQLLADTSNKKALSFYSGSGWSQTSLICLRKYITTGPNEPDSDT